MNKPKERIDQDQIAWCDQMMEYKVALIFFK